MLHLTCVAIVGAAPAAVNENDVVGRWKLSFNPGDGDSESILTITRAESDLKAMFVRGERTFQVTSIKYQDGRLTFCTESQRDGQVSKATFEGKVEADTIKGDGSWDYNGNSGSFPFIGSREARKASAEALSLVLVPGKPNLTGAFDVGELGYEIEEFFISGTATSYKLAGEATADGKWEAVPATNAPYTTRIVVVRPKESAKFSGTAAVEWLNVTGGLDVPVDWNIAHREILRRGHAYVAVSAQKVGIDGNPMAQGGGPSALKKADPARYGRLNHPGDAHSFDIFSQAGALVKDTATSKILGPLVPNRVIAVGESQSAYFLTTYVTAVDPVAKVYDGFLIHSRFGNAPPMDANPFALFTGAGPVPRLRSDLRVPVITVITESDLLGFGPLKGYSQARQPDTDKLRVWEIAGSAHADNYVFSVGFIDSGTLPIEKLAAAFAPSFEMFGQKLPQAMNFGPQHHYVTEAALWQLDRWIKTGQAAPKGAALKLTQDKPPKLVTDANGIAEGGIRTPWVDVPTAILSGAGSMVGFGKPFDSATIERLYPGGKADYLKKFEASLDSAIQNGFIVPEDKTEIMGLASCSFPAKEDSTKAKN